MALWRAATVVAALVVAVGCAPVATPQTTATNPQSSSSAAPKRILAAIQSNPPTLSSNQVGAGSGTLQGGDGLEDLANGGMSVLNNQGGVEPQLAEAVPSVENGLWKVLPDGRMETTWRIREGAQWHDGTPFTAGDLLFSIKLGQDKDLRSSRTLASRASTARKRVILEPSSSPGSGCTSRPTGSLPASSARSDLSTCSTRRTSRTRKRCLR